MESSTLAYWSGMTIISVSKRVMTTTQPKPRIQMIKSLVDFNETCLGGAEYQGGLTDTVLNKIGAADFT